MPDYRPLPAFAANGRSVLFVDADSAAHELYEAGQQRLEAARRLALLFMCGEQPVEDGDAFAAVYLLLNDAAGLHEAAFQRARRR
ncbi:hypothetical protein BZL41_20245 [Pseudomonas sp. PIC25]|uniref:hypothetical protein n=1 Tax=Pseudomonas sp. PIC25 TaxID=1958773 RepID=UPI000BAB3B98|nr:hypothetical protein [Pseudomonas sp. PIC25]PAU56052.1 hypothetical protein BZL41_20245 [Pseudomonas sp. PIC25]